MLYFQNIPQNVLPTNSTITQRLERRVYSVNYLITTARIRDLTLTFSTDGHVSTFFPIHDHDLQPGKMEALLSLFFTLLSSIYYWPRCSIYDSECFSRAAAALFPPLPITQFQDRLCISTFLYRNQFHFSMADFLCSGMHALKWGELIVYLMRLDLWVMMWMYTVTWYLDVENTYKTSECQLESCIFLNSLWLHSSNIILNH